MNKHWQNLFFTFLFFALLAGGANIAFANVVINEIMYDLEGSDTKNEWVEIFNDSSSEVNLKDWKFNDGSNHILNEPPKNGGRGFLILPAIGYAILSADAAIFVNEHQNYAGGVIDTAMSLGNTKETLKLIDNNGIIVDSVVYESSQGANGDGNSLQKTVSGWAAAVPTPGIQNSNNNQPPQNNPPPDNPPPNSNQQQPATESAGGASWPTEDQIFVNAGEDKTAVVGADLTFSGKTLGIKKEPLENARHSWNFGDGASAEGQNVRHFYKYPGNYIAVLDVSSGKFSASDRLNVKVIPNELQITEANKDFIKLKNKSNVLLDVSGWFLRAPDNPASVKTTAGRQIFMFPESSLIAANSDLIISSDVSKITADGNGELVELLYPNGAAAFAYKVNIQPLIIASQISSPDPSPLKRGGGERSKPGEDDSVKHSVFDNDKTENTIVRHSVSNNATATDSGQKDQLANVIAAVDKKDFWEGKWIFLAILLGIFAAAGLFFMRRYGDTPPKSDIDEFDSQ